MVTINLLPAKVRQTKVVLRFYTYIIIAGSLLVLVLILLLLNMLAQTKRLESKTLSLQNAEAQLADKIKPLQGLAEQEKRNALVRSWLAELSREQPVWIGLLDDLADRVQSDMWLTKIQSLPDAKQRRLVLAVEGEAYNKLSIADFLTALEASPLFRHVTLEALAESESGAKAQVQFKLKLEYAGEVGAPMPAAELRTTEPALAPKGKKK